MESDSSTSSYSSCQSGSSYRNSLNNRVYSPLQSRIVDGLATLMSSSGAAAATSENIHPVASTASTASGIGKQVATAAAPLTSTATTTSSSSRVPLGTLQNNSLPRLPTAAAAASSSSPNTSRLLGKMLRVERGENCGGGSPSKRSRLHPQSPLSKLNAKSENVFKPQSGRKLKLRESWSRFREFVNSAPKTQASPSPFPEVRFACKQQLWNVMLKKESGMYLRDADVMDKHSNLQPRMRSILIDWMVEVSEVYKLHRETLYLAVDFIDRYLAATKDMPRNRLQLVGVTCLFIASKIEEIYPPKLREFAFVTDGACAEEEITQMELVILKGLNWGLSPFTPNRWIKTYMQVNSLLEDAKEHAMKTGDTTSSTKLEISERFVMTQFQELDYLRAMQLMDLVMLDIGSLAFKYSVLAAAVIYHCHDEHSALGASGYKWEDISACVDWMAPFVFAIRESNSTPVLKVFADTIPEDYHNIQTHSMEMSVLEDAQARQQLLAEEMTRSRLSPDPTTAISAAGTDMIVSDAAFQALVMTPPADATSCLSSGSQTAAAAKAAAAAAASTATNSEANIDARRTVHQLHPQSSVFLSPTSEAENSGFW